MFSTAPLLFNHGHQTAHSNVVYVYSELEHECWFSVSVCVRVWGPARSPCRLCSFFFTAAFPAACHRCLASALLSVCPASNGGILKQGAGWLTRQHRLSHTHCVTGEMWQSMQPSSSQWTLWCWICASMVIFIIAQPACTDWNCCSVSNFYFILDIYNIIIDTPW